MAILIFKNTGENIELPNGSSLTQSCEEAGVPFACTEGICGTCVVEVLDGMENLSAMTEEEKDFLGVQDRERLACQCKINCKSVTISF